MYKTKKYSTDKYLCDVEYVNSLDKINIKCEKKREFNIDSLLWLFKRKVHFFYSASKVYILELCCGFNFIKDLNRLRFSKKGKKVLLLGNGPSQGFIDLKTLEIFKSNGGELIVVNYWNENVDLTKVVPDFLVVSDPTTLSHPVKNDEAAPEYLKEKNSKLENYILHHDICLVCPVLRYKQLRSVFQDKNIICFSDSEYRYSKNIDPRFPRGYTSMTLYKALAFAVHLGYDNIYMLGMDNTYSRDIYSNNNNEILRRETHVGINDHVANLTNFYNSIGDCLIENSFLFKDLEAFSKVNGIVNLDPYSLTNCFVKMESIENSLNVLRKGKQNHEKVGSD